MIIHHYKAVYKNYFVAAFPLPKIEVQQEIRRWCWKTFGKPGYMTCTADVRWHDDIDSGEVRLSQESDLMMFLLRWS